LSNLSADIAGLTPRQRMLVERLLKKEKPGPSRSVAVTRRGEAASYPLSFAQYRLWFLHQLEPQSVAYNLRVAIRLKGRLDVQSLERALSELVRRHESLRTRFAVEACQPVQVISSETDFTVARLSITEAEVMSFIEKEANQPFDLQAGSLFRASLLRVDAEEHVLVLLLHHIISDGWSAGVLFRELGTLYAAYAAGEESPLAELPVQYADYAVWQRENLSGEVLNAQVEYWRERLAGAAPVLELPADRVRPAVQSYRGATVPFEVSREVSEGLKALSRREGVTLFMTLLAAFKVLLYRYTGQADIVVGSPIAGRTRAEVENLIGFFVNTLVLRTDLSGGPSFRELLGRVRETALGAYAHQDVPFEKLVEELQPERDLSRSPLFQVMFALQNAPREELQLKDLKLSFIKSANEVAKFDLSLFMFETEQAVKGIISYNADLFEAATIERMVAHFQVLLEAILIDPQQSVSQLPLLREAESRQLLVDWNQTHVSYPAHSSIHELFEQQVERTPEAIALICEEQSLTYAELNRRANQLAYQLQALGVGPEVLVGILMERSVEMVVSVLAALKAGGAYVPIDPQYPAERISFMLADTAVPVLLTQRSLAHTLPSHDAHVLCVDELSPASEDAPNPEAGVTRSNLAYVIYTSGSTGRSKGVAVEHRQLLNYVQAVSDELDLPARGSFATVSTFAADLAHTMIYPALMRGGCLHLITEARAADPKLLGQYFAAHQIDCLKIVPSHLAALLADVTAGVALPQQRLVLGGEESKWWLIERIDELSPAQCVVYNHYGPTEATVGVLTWRVEREKQQRSGVPLGRPLGNVRAYVVDKDFQPVPVGVTGELLIGGAGVARGYLQRPELTAERFIPDPFGGEGGRLYRTGDLVRYLADGEIEFLGRVDNQVKVRGFRIELGEIEAVLQSVVKEAVVVVREDVLVAYVVGTDLPTKELRAQLKLRLPEYMVPSAFVLLDELPLTANGKVDRKALPAPATDLSATSYVAPRTPVEEMLCGIWAEVLGVRGVGVDANFFEVGGHSLKATQVISRIRESFRVQLPLRTIFEAPSIETLAANVERALRAGERLTESPLRRVSRETAIPLSLAQQRLWFLHELEPESAAYNIVRGLRLQGRLKVAALEAALAELMRRHEVLRTMIGFEQGQPVQIISAPASYSLPVVEVADVDGVLAEEGRRVFDLRRGPLLRVKLLRVSEQEHVLVLAMHHIISDGWSAGVFFRELSALYAAYAAGEESPLQELPIQYADYAVWQRGWLQGEVLEQQLTYWRERLTGAAPMLELPADRVRPAVQSYRGAVARFEVSREVSEGLKALSQREGVTLFMTLLAAFKVLLYRYTGQADMVVGSPIAGRTRAEVENLIGFFVNTLVLRTDLSGGPSFRELLGRVRETALGAYAHQDVPFERLVEELQPERDLSRSPLFQVMFALQNAPQKSLQLEGLTLSYLKTESRVAKFDLLLFMADSADGIKGALEYNTDLFEPATIERLLSHFRILLEAIVAQPERAVTELPLLSDAERRQLLVEWNETDVEAGTDSCIHHMFEEQVVRTPLATALVFGKERLTYAELNQRANQLAHHLQSLGVGPEVLVAILMERSLEMVVSLLAVLKAGGAYVPLDPQYPAERIAFMLCDTSAPVLLTQQRLLESLPAHEAQVVCVDRIWPRLATEKTTNPESSVTSFNLAYVIYTSGSTGRPKGVAIAHRSTTLLLCWAERTFSGEELAVTLASTSICFDLSIFELFVPLSCGGSVVLVENALRLPEVSAHGITLVNTVPSAMAELVRSGAVPETVRVVNLAGEALGRRLVEQVYAASRVEAVWNLYGPTEDTTYTTAALVARGAERVTIGRAVAGTQLYILDGELEAVPVGVAGELYIGGAGLARGYLGRAELTAERFIADPFGEGGRLYRTGDLVRYLADGRLEYLGRVDHQVKVRGFRIELGEIAAALQSVAAVKEAVVIVREDEAGEKRLVAYVTPKDVETSELRAYLKQRLPDYMMPSAFVYLDELPLTPNAKVDRKALPAPETDLTAAATYIAPRTQVEEMLCAIWSKVLGVEGIGVNVSFFEVGGHSLKATQVISRIRESFQVELPLRAMFESPTIESLTVAIAKVLFSEESEVANLLNDLEQLSDDETKELLFSDELPA
jgi:amino acid adenylation domain-containing protein